MNIVQSLNVIKLPTGLDLGLMRDYDQNNSTYKPFETVPACNGVNGGQWRVLELRNASPSSSSSRHVLLFVSSIKRRNSRSRK